MQVLINGLVVGVVYILIASGLSLIFSIMRIVNFAHGEFYMLGAFGIYYLYAQLHIPFFVSLLVTALAVALLGIIVERLLFRPFRAPEYHTLNMIISVGLIMLMEGIGFAIFKPVERVVNNPWPGSIEITSVVLPLQRVFIILGGIVIIVCLFAFVRWSKIGAAMRAVAEDEQAAALQGININSTRMTAFAIGCALAAIAGGLMATGIVVHPGIGMAAIFRAFIVVVLGGLGSIAGAALGGIILGLIESFGTYFIGYWATLISFLLLILILLVRPKGLLGHE